MARSVHVVTSLPHYPQWQLTPEDRRRLRRDERHRGVNITRLRQVVPRRQSTMRRGAYEASFLAHGLTARRTWPRPDVVVAVTPALAGAALGAVEARRAKAPLVVIVQDLVSAAAGQSGIGAGPNVVSGLARAEGWLLRRASAVGVVHEAFRSRCLDLGVPSSRLHVVPNWTKESGARGELGRVEVRDQYGWGDAAVVLHAGNMGHKQGLDIVVEAARLARNRDENIRFVLMGHGSQRDTLKEAAAGLPNLELIDPVDEDTFPAMLAASDVLLLTQRGSVSDMSVPSKLTSYFQAGRPVLASVASDSAAATEVRAARAGLIVPPDTAEDLLIGLTRILQDRAVAEGMGEAGRAYSAERLSADAGLARVATLVCSSLGGVAP